MQIVIGILILFLLWTLLFVRVVCVCGNSMYPTLKDGEFILVTRVLDQFELKSGDIVIADPPMSYHGEYVVKRIRDIKDGSVFLLGDNRDDSYDSREYGYIPVSSVKFKMVKKIRVKGDH